MPEETQKIALVLTLGRESATGETRVISTWREVLPLLGYKVELFELTKSAKFSVVSIFRSIPSVVKGHAVPESLLWSRKAVGKKLSEVDPDLVVCITARSFDGPLLARQRVLLNWVDDLGTSYRQRASINKNILTKIGMLTLSVFADRFRKKMGDKTGDKISNCYAGFIEAEKYGSNWVPITYSDLETIDDSKSKRFDMVFVGNLGYEPNIQGIRRIDKMWPSIIRDRPTASLLLAGRRPTDEVMNLASKNNWEVKANFDSAKDVYSSARIAIVPGQLASGIQIKIIDAAVVGISQVIDINSARGFPPDAPLVTASTDQEFIDAIELLLNDKEQSNTARDRSREFFVSEFSPKEVARKVSAMLSSQ